jgi:hypothetical protein
MLAMAGARKGLGGCGMTTVDGEGSARQLEPVLGAVVLALASAVPVAWVLQAAPPALEIEAVGWHPLGTGQAIALAMGAVIPAAVLGGGLGGVVQRRRPVLGVVTALAVAWAVGIVALPIGATILDIPLRAGIHCFDSCVAALRDGDPLAGVEAYGESLVVSVIALPLLAIPAILFVLARVTQRPAVSVLAWLSAHAVLDAFSIVRAAPIYALLVVGVVLWSLWLGASDARTPVLQGARRRWAVLLVPAAVVIAVTSAVASLSWVPAVPVNLQPSFIGTANVQGFNPPDPGDWLQPIVVPRTPAGSGCFDSIEQPSGRLDLCWEAYRDNREQLPGADLYQFRLLATLHAATPTSWVVISIRPVGDERTRVDGAWPSGVLDGPCHATAVTGMDFLTDDHETHDEASDLACGRTTGAVTNDGRQWAIWTCAACGAEEAAGRQVAMRQLAATTERSVPSWQVYADVGP